MTSPEQIDCQQAIAVMKDIFGNENSYNRLLDHIKDCPECAKKFKRIESNFVVEEGLDLLSEFVDSELGFIE
ncbi:hypothetical protein K9M79_08090 [Candidatus Woesearchaeota archaeon]|nr:hypothetical protein [Candidatus Woesearchaeota archaeon]